MRLILTLLFLVLAPLSGQAAKPEVILNNWYKLVLQLVRHTPTYSPPVASRSFAYLSVAAYEGLGRGHSLVGQLNGLHDLPKRDAGKIYDDAVVLEAILSSSTQHYFSNTGPSGQNAIKATAKKLRVIVAEGLDQDVIARSESYGNALAEEIYNWSKTDGGSNIENLGFPLTYSSKIGPTYWVPTSKIALQQKPLLPNWGMNRSFAMPSGATCVLPPPPAYSEDKETAFYKEALEVFETSKTLTPEQKAIARFWSDDAMLSPTPPGHWISIALQLFETQKTPIADQVDVLARLGVVEADAFIGCWHEKYKYEYLRPVTFIKRSIDPNWESLLTTPPFPEYPSGHSTLSSAAATVLTQYFGENFSFDDATHIRDGIEPRHFSNFQAAAEEAALSRLYGGIHFRSAIEFGLKQGRCIGAFSLALKTRK